MRNSIKTFLRVSKTINVYEIKNARVKLRITKLLFNDFRIFFIIQIVLVYYLCSYHLAFFI